MHPVGKIAVALTVLLGEQRARAEEMFGFPIRVGVFGGWHATADDYDVLGERREELVPGAGPMFGLRLGVRLNAPFALELELGAVAASVDAEGGTETAWLVPLSVSLDWRALAGDAAWTPIVGLGGGVAVNAAGPGSGDLDLLLCATAGVEVDLGDIAALRLEGGVLVSDGVASAISWTPIVTLGIDFIAWRVRKPREPEPPPEIPRPELPVGCPAGVHQELCLDSDGDGRIDAYDPCPLEPSTRHDSCSDPDGDNVVRERDACPDARGLPSDWGCPRRTEP